MLDFGRHFAALALLCTSSMLAADVRAENIWGYTCKSLEDCLKYIQRPSNCVGNEETCWTNWYSEESMSGIRQEFKKYGRAAIPKLLDLLVDGPPHVRVRVTDALHGSEFMRPEDGRKVHEAWRRGGTWNASLATNFATPAFIKEVIDALRRDPEENGLAGQTFSNFREYAVPGTEAAIVAHIECAAGEPCNPGFARLQYNWIDSNVEDVGSVAPRLIEAIRNPRNSVEAKIEAAGYFRISEHFRTRDAIEPYAVPILTELLGDKSPELRLEAALLLSTYGDSSGIVVLLTSAHDSSPANRLRAIEALADHPETAAQHVEEIQLLLGDEDWNVRRRATMLLGFLGDKASVGRLVSSIDSSDWLQSYSAVLALRQIDSSQASAALKLVSSNYWHPLVREAAAGSAPSFTADRTGRFEFEVEDMSVDRMCQTRFEKDGYRFVPDFIYAPEVYDEVKQAVLHNEGLFKNSLLSVTAMKGAKPASNRLEYLGWKFTGSDVYGGTGELSAEDGRGHVHQVMAANVKGVFVWQGQPHVVSDGQEAQYSNEGWLFRLRLSGNGKWLTERVMRLTGSPEVWLTSGGTIGVLGSSGAMLISPQGNPKWIHCPIPSFP